MAVNVNKEKQSNLNSYIIETPKTSNKRDQPSSSPDNASPSMIQVEKQARLTSLASSLSDPTTQSPINVGNISPEHVMSSIRKETVVQLSDVVCATLKNQDFIQSLIPLISEKVMEFIKPRVVQLIDDCVQAHMSEIKNNKDALILQESEQKKQRDEMRALRNKIVRMESRLEEQEQYSRRTSLRFNNVKLPTDGRGNIMKQFDTDTMVLEICKNQLNVDLQKTDIGRSHPIGEIRDGKMSIIVRFLSYRQRQLVFSNKKKLKTTQIKHS